MASRQFLPQAHTQQLRRLTESCNSHDTGSKLAQRISCLPEDMASALEGYSTQKIHCQNPLVDLAKGRSRQQHISRAPNEAAYPGCRSLAKGRSIQQHRLGVKWGTVPRTQKL